MNKIISTRLGHILLNKTISYKFCYNWAPLDPRKHNTMNHNVHNMYLDLY